MPQVTGSIRTWQFQPFPPDEKLVVKFIPSSAGSVGSTLLPLREEHIEPDANGGIDVNLAETTLPMQDVFFRIVLEWFVRDRLNEQWVTRGRSEVPGELRVPPSGGNLADLLKVPPTPGIILRGYGPPPDSLDNVTYWDLSGPRPVLYLPEGALI